MKKFLLTTCLLASAFSSAIELSAQKVLRIYQKNNVRREVRIDEVRDITFPKKGKVRYQTINFLDGRKAVIIPTSEIDSVGIRVMRPEGDVQQLVFNESCNSGLGSLREEMKKKNGKIKSVWYFDSRYKCAKASAFKEGDKIESESWLVTPYIDLTDAIAPALSFEHAIAHFNGKEKEMTALRIATEEGQWEELPIDVWSEKNWKFVVNKLLLREYAGHYVRLAFVYKSTTAVAGTWEIKNLKIEDTVKPEVNPDPTDPETPINPDVPVDPNAPVTIFGGYKEIPAVQNSFISTHTLKYVEHYYQGSKRNFSLLMDKDLKYAYWVAYPMCANHTHGNKRSENWGYDSEVPESWQANMRKGLGSGYDRGHQCRSSDRAFNITAMHQTYKFTNMTPQLGGLNQHYWLQLENYVQSLTSTTDTLFVVTGAMPLQPGETKDQMRTMRNKNDGAILPVPAYYFKALCRINKRNGKVETVAWKVDHKAYSKDTSVKATAISVAELERMTGFIFFPTLAKPEDKATITGSWF